MPAELRIVATDPGDLTRPAVQALRELGFGVEVLPAGLSGDEAAARAADADIVLAGIVPLHRSSMEIFRRVRLIIRCGAGVDSVDVPAATARRIWVANVPDYCVEEVADHAILLLLAAARYVRVFQGQVGQGRWKDLEYPPVRRLHGQTLGLIGFGRIGARVALRAAALGLGVVVHDPFASDDRLAAAGAKRSSLEDLLRTSHLISLHCPLTPETHHLLDGAAFTRMRSGVVLVNTSRGALIDLDALDAAFEAGTIAAAGLDVVDGEPEPDVGHRVFLRREVVLTPHIAFYSVDAQEELGRKVAEEALRFQSGEAPLNAVNPSARDRP